MWWDSLSQVDDIEGILQSKQCCNSMITLILWSMQRAFHINIKFEEFLLLSYFATTILSYLSSSRSFSFQLSSLVTSQSRIFYTFVLLANSIHIVLWYYEYTLQCPGLWPSVQEGCGAVGAAAGPQTFSESWTTSPTKTSWKSWACSAWRREGATSLGLPVLEGCL